MHSTKIENNINTLFIVPALLVVIIMISYPFFSNLFYSFLDYTLVNPVKKFILFDNYIKIISSRDFLLVLKRTLIWTVSNITFMLALGLSTSILFTKSFRGKNILKACILIPWVLPETVSGYTWRWMLSSEYGIINIFLEHLGLLPIGFSWFKTGAAAMTAVIVANVWRGFPFMAVMLYAKLKTHPKERIEAARIDGANGLQVFRHLILPYLSGTIKACTLLAFIWTFNAFGIIYSMTKGGPISKTETFPFIVQKTAFKFYEFSQASTMSIIMFLIMAAVIYGMYLPGKLAGKREL